MSPSKMPALFVSFALLLSTVQALADGGQPYLNGHQLAKSYQALVDIEKGFWIPVPVDYTDPDKGTTEIYAHFANDFERSRNTMVIFTGGPGQTSHFPPDHKLYEYYSNLGFNALILDQRGIAFSRPATEALWLDRGFYSSESVARDFDTVRKFLGISKWTVYGASYGTVPATIYAALFPTHTTSLVLEGIVGGGFDDIPWQSYYTADKVQAYYDSLPLILRNKIDRSSVVQPVYQQFLPTYAKAYLMAGGSSFLPALTARLNAAIAVSDRDFWLTIASAPENPPESLVPPDENFVNQVLMIKEFGQGRCDVSDNLILQDGKILKTTTNPKSEYCLLADEWGIPSDITARKSTFDISHYKVTVPVFYLEGADDAATTPAWGIRHSIVVPQAGFQFFIFKDVGHNVGGRLQDSSDRQSQRDQFTAMFKKMLSGESVTRTEVSQYNHGAVYPVTMFRERSSARRYFDLFFRSRSAGIDSDNDPLARMGVKVGEGEARTIGMCDAN